MWNGKQGMIDESSDDKFDLMMNDNKVEVLQETNGLSDCKENCEHIGHGNGSDSDREELYIDKGQKGDHLCMNMMERWIQSMDCFLAM